MAKKKPEVIEENYEENISVEPLEDVMGDRYATYAKYVIRQYVRGRHLAKKSEALFELSTAATRTL